MATTFVNSADSHVIEPAELWLANMPASLRDRAPHTKREPRRGREYEVIYVDDRAVRYEPPGFQDRMRPPGAYDPAARMSDLDEQGIWAELLFPSVGLWCYLIETPQVAIAAARTYNDWLLDTFMKRSERYLGTAMIPLVDIADAVGEIERAAGLGYRGALLPATPPTPYNDERYGPVFAALVETGMTPCLHVGTGSDPMVTRGAGGAIINYTETFFPMMRSTLNFVASGIFDRHPSLHLFCVEGGASWLPGLMERMDEAAREHADWVKPKLSGMPSEVIREHVHATFQHDKAVLLTLEVTGVESIVWGSDYPHLEGTWPDTKRILDDIFDGVDDATRRAITGGTLGERFGVVAPV
jgi:predicted TIM-barrel fold metal-dependent hydrolase